FSCDRRERPHPPPRRSKRPPPRLCRAGCVFLEGRGGGGAGGGGGRGGGGLGGDEGRRGSRDAPARTAHWPTAGIGLELTTDEAPAPAPRGAKPELRETHAARDHHHR